MSSVIAPAQPSLFSAELAVPELDDLGGLLAAHGQLAGGPGGPRLSILLAESWRAQTLAAACARRGVAAEVIAVPADGEHEALLVRSERSPRLGAVAERWTRGAVKAAPADLVVDAGLLRLWTIAAGRPGPLGYLLGLDPHATGTHQPLVAAMARAGLPGPLVGVQSGAFAVRVTGVRRLARLAEMVGSPPDDAPVGSWPIPRG